jgi:uncharacterized PurR-regulated membrane protein YhhQ (DUF165 family)
MREKIMNCICIVLYLLAIAGANIITASTAPLSFGVIIVPIGTFFIGATFVLRCLVQNAVGRKATYVVIAAAMLLSAITSHTMGDTLWIVFASAATFLLSESTDTEIYTRLKLPMSLKVLYSGIVSGFVDSVVFVIIGLSPLGANFLPWNAVGYAILGQILVKTLLQFVGAGLFGIFAKKKVSVEGPASRQAARTL